MDDAQIKALREVALRSDGTVHLTRNEAISLLDRLASAESRAEAAMPREEEIVAMKRGLGGRLAEDGFARLDAYRPPAPVATKGGE
jgi:hypothetical protein